ncbi:MAG: cellulase family glycosylhydrolase [Candidatus Synoicihabitans palmerolidicus]|nr:cellulase family glycosylhydrolase [Candidatus Synoicihabitans palmerolidicus]
MKFFDCCLAFLISASLALPAFAGNSSSFKRGVNISHWLAQHAPGKYATAERFSAEDAAWIAEHGFDHVRIHIDGRILLSIEGKLIEELLEPLDQALQWCEANHLGVILDMHYLPGNEFFNEAADNALWRDPELRVAAASLWTQIAKKYQDVGPWVRYEILNEAVAPENGDLNILNQLIFEAIARSMPTESSMFPQTAGASFRPSPTSDSSTIPMCTMRGTPTNRFCSLTKCLLDSTQGHPCRLRYLPRII